jgi:bla regulator protein BlaR1
VQRLVAAAGLIAVFSCGASAQAQTVPTKFDVATIKPNAASDDRFALRPLPGGALSAIGVPLKMLIMQAYSLKAFQISGEPDWVDTVRWDIEAKVEGFPGRLSQAQAGTMLRALLEDRFQLNVRRETKEMPVYALVVAKNGAKLTPHTGETPPPGQAIRSGRGLFSIKEGGIGLLASQLESQLSRVVIDKTELKGKYDYTLEWTPEAGEGGPESLGLPPQSASAAPTDSKGPSIFTALQEQLGLRLESQKGPVEVIVIERVAKPSEN